MTLRGCVLVAAVRFVLGILVFSAWTPAQAAANIAAAAANASPAVQPEASADTAVAAQGDSLSSADSAAAAAATDGPKDANAAAAGGSLWKLILEAIAWGFAALLTPCVFPMIPMTVSFFLHGSEEEQKKSGKFRAFMYGIFIILLYTLPIAIIILLTLLIGGHAVTADIFNWLATNWIPNIIFFIVFMIFAASFFGAFEITMPEKLVNGSDKNSNKKGLLGVFFMALTTVLVSFSCTGPIVGTVLIKSTSGEFWTPILTMLAFSVAFALPFTLFALFPSLLKKIKGGSWLNTFKVVLGFVELALGMKFLQVADQTYHWGILPREIYLAFWIVIFAMLGFYLLGKLRFKYDEPVEHISFFRLILAIFDFMFVVYMIPGMWGDPLKGLSGYLPPIQTQDFVIPSTAELKNLLPEGTASYPGAAAAGSIGAAAAADPNSSAYYPIKYANHLELSHNLKGFFDLKQAEAYSEHIGKPVFLDFTGVGCMQGRPLAYIGLVSQRLMKKFGIRQPVYAAEMNWETFFSLVKRNQVKYKELPKFPEVRRDLALLFDQGTSYAEIRRVALNADKRCIKQVNLFDVYTGSGVPAGKKQYALSFTLQDPDQTLAEAYLENLMSRLLKAFQDKFGAELR